MAGSGTAHLRPEDDMLLRVEHLVVDFPAGRADRVGGGRRELRRGRGRDPGPGGRVRLRQVDDRPGRDPAASPTSRYDVRRPRPHGPGEGERLRVVRPQMQIVFQDPISSLNPRRRSATSSVPPSRSGRSGTEAERRPTSTRCLEAVGLDPERGARQAAPRVLRRPVPAHLHRPGPGARAPAADLRRAGVGARRVGAGADPQPARGPQGPLRPHAGVHHPRPGGGEERQRPGGGHVPGQALRGGPAERLYAAPATRTPPRCCRRSRCPIPRSRPGPRAGRRRAAVAGCARRAAAGSAPAAPGPRTAALRRSPRPARWPRGSTSPATSRW